MNKEFTKKESHDKLVKLSSVITTIITVFQILLIVGAAVCAISTILGFLGFGLGWPNAIYEKFRKLASVTIDYKADLFDMDLVKEKITVKELYEANMLNKLALGLAINSFVGAIQCAVIFVALTLLKPLFKTITKSESPFTYEILNKLKFAFVLITIVILFKSVFIGIIVALFLACIYFMYMYGVKMQEDEDMTL